jgi:hypothetical protein
LTKEAAVRAVRREIDANWTRVSFAKKAKIDPGTLADFLEGKRWAHRSTQAKIEQTLGWAVGSIEDLAHGVPFEQAVGPGGHTPTHAATGRLGPRDLSDLSLEQLAEEQRRIADEMLRRARDGRS